ncbi:condensin complex subunit 2-like [Scleropages formosus]|uniref:Condensin complex subunit 2 n=1 Tax=Scleropages formosus TaxID=113540 RepID=A0A0P7TPF9_SCLFO|nr:condensin complex subunit 2-like [Scleropages formosus]
MVSSDMSATSTPTSRAHQWASPSLAMKGSILSSTPVLAAFPGNDDETERRQRRRSRVMDLQGALDASVTDSPAHSVSGTPAAVPKLSSAQISEHYSTCIKLSTENKITTKNAFGLHLIDYMAEILKQKDSELTNFKVAAGTLDASTKIYAVRVDAVHADAYRVLGGLGSETKSGEEKDAEDEPGSEGGDTATKQALKKKRPPKKTVEQNLSNINSAESERKCEVDPMFQRMASSFDESSTAGVFLSVLFSEDNHCELLFPSYLTLLRSAPPSPPSPPKYVPAQPFKGGLQLSQDKSSICPSLEDFSFTRRNPDQTINQLLEKMKLGQHAFDVNAEVEPEERDCQDFGDDFDADDCEMGQDDGEEGPRDHKEACAMTPLGKGRDVIAIGKGDITTMCLQLSSQPREYSYFSPRTMAMWAGPGYWRFKPRHKQDHVSDKENQKRKPKKIFELDFDKEINFDTYFRTTRAATTNNKSALHTCNKKTTLPADFHYPPETLSQLSFKPSNTLCKQGAKRVSGELGEAIGDYNYNNANDTANFCPGLQGGQSDDDTEELGGVEEYEATLQPFTEEIPCSSQDGDNISTYREDNLVPEPYKVKKMEINYAKTAKKMDMKKLKNTMWRLLTDCLDKPVKEVENTEGGNVSGEKAFSKTTKTLFQRLPSSMAQNLSIPLAFVALLHLANEKNLELLKVDDMSDIIIKQGH